MRPKTRKPSQAKKALLSRMYATGPVFWGYLHGEIWSPSGFYLLFGNGVVVVRNGTMAAWKMERKKCNGKLQPDPPLRFLRKAC